MEAFGRPELAVALSCWPSRCHSLRDDFINDKTAKISSGGFTAKKHFLLPWLTFEAPSSLSLMSCPMNQKGTSLIQQVFTEQLPERP